jgi:hypothetical protein
MDILLDLAGHGIFEKRDSMHLDIEWPLSHRGAVNFFKSPFGFITMFTWHIDMEGLHSFIIRNSTGLVELNGSPPETDWNLFTCLQQEMGFDRVTQSHSVHHIMGPQEP